MADIRDYFLARREELTQEITQLKQKQHMLQTLYGASASDAIAEQQGIIEAKETKLKAIDAVLSGHDPEGLIEAQVEQGLASIQLQQFFEVLNPSELSGPILDLTSRTIPVLSGALNGALDREAAKQTLQSIVHQLGQFRDLTLSQIEVLSQASSPDVVTIARLQEQLQTYAADTAKIKMLMQVLTTPSSAPAESSHPVAPGPSTGSPSPDYAHTLPGTTLYMPSAHTDEALAVSQTTTEGQSSTDIPSAAPTKPSF